MITYSKYADGWKSTTIIVHGHLEDVVIAPDGTRYVKANDNGRADLIVDHTNGRFKELGRSRWRVLETGSKAQNHNIDAIRRPDVTCEFG